MISENYIIFKLEDIIDCNFEEERIEMLQQLIKDIEYGSKIEN